MPAKMLLSCQNGARVEIALCPIENIQYNSSTLFKCDLCSRIFKMRSRLKQHIWLVHNVSRHELYKVGHLENVIAPAESPNSEIKTNGENLLDRCKHLNNTKMSISTQVNSTGPMTLTINYHEEENNVLELNGMGAHNFYSKVTSMKTIPCDAVTEETTCIVSLHNGIHSSPQIVTASEELMDTMLPANDTITDCIVDQEKSNINTSSDTPILPISLLSRFELDDKQTLRNHNTISSDDKIITESSNSHLDLNTQIQRVTSSENHKQCYENENILQIEATSDLNTDCFENHSDHDYSLKLFNANMQPIVLLYRITTTESMSTICKSQTRVSGRQRKPNKRYENNDFIINTMQNSDFEFSDDSDDYEIGTKSSKPKLKRMAHNLHASFRSPKPKIEKQKTEVDSFTPDVEVEGRKRKIRLPKRFSDHDFVLSQCTMCHKSFSSQRYLPRHIKHVHQNIRDYHCQICSSKFKTNGDLNRHIISVHFSQRIFQCTICCKLFKMKQHLKDHKRASHATERKFACDLCSGRFTVKARLKNHMAYAHYGERKFGCNMCGAKFKLKSHLVSHIKGMHLKLRQKCSICSKNFFSLSNMYTHIKGVHKNVKEKKCTLCSRRFTYRCSLVYHMRSVHEGQRPYQCDECDRAYKLRSHLLHHISYYHFHKKNYPCPKCKKQFASKTGLTTHINCVHDKIRNFSCRICEKRFYLKQHLLTHIEGFHNKKFECGLCYRYLSSSTCLKKHISNVHTLFS